MFSFDTKTVKVYRVAGNDFLHCKTLYFYAAMFCTLILPQTKTANYGLIFTYLWAFDQPSDWEYVNHISELFTKRNGEVYYVELVTTQEERLKRNQTQNRLENKPSKRKLDESKKNLLDVDKWWRCESKEGEIPFEYYLKIDNTSLSPEDVAKIIKIHFNFQ